VFYSQSAQDEWVNKIFRGKRDGFYLDIGAYDGIESSNTAFFGRELGWNGICVDANRSAYDRLVINRPDSINVFAAVNNYDGTCRFTDYSINDYGDEVPCYKLNTIMEKYNAPNVIDYMSIDIEGSEFIVLSCFDFDRWQVGSITLEHNLYSAGSEEKNKLYDLLTSNGFIRVVEDVLCLDTHPSVYQQPYEDWYVNTSVIGELDL
jgi:hypothetical protein